MSEHSREPAHPLFHPASLAGGDGRRRSCLAGAYPKHRQRRSPLLSRLAEVLVEVLLRLMEESKPEI